MTKGNESLHEFNELLTEKTDELSQILHNKTMVSGDFNEEIDANLQAITMIHKVFLAVWDEISDSLPATSQADTDTEHLVFALLVENLIDIRGSVLEQSDNGELSTIVSTAFAEIIDEVLDELAEMGHLVFEYEDTMIPAQEFLEFMAEEEDRVEVILDNPHLTETQLGHLLGYLAGVQSAQAHFIVALEEIREDPSAGLISHGVFPVFADMIQTMAIQLTQGLEDTNSTGLVAVTEGSFDIINVLMNEMLDMGVIAIED